MANSFLDKTGLTYLWGKIVALVNRKQDALTFDSTPTENSSNPVTSAGIKAYVDENAGGDCPVESGSGEGSVQTVAVVSGSRTFIQTASGDAAFAEGRQTTASGIGAHSEGTYTTASGDASHSEGSDAIASGHNSHVEGENTISRGNCSHAEGQNTTANANYSHAEGSYGIAYGTASHVEGGDDLYTHSFSLNDEVSDNVYKVSSIPSYLRVGSLLTIGTVHGQNEIYRVNSIDTANLTVTLLPRYVNSYTYPVTAYCHVLSSIGKYSHAEGQSTSVGGYSHAEGLGCVAQGKYSHAEGQGTIANSAAQHVEGKYNVEDATGTGTYAHIVGNGTSSARSNAHTLDWNGNAWYAGTVSAGTVENPATVTNANDLATKAYVDANAGGDSPVESRGGVGSVQTKAYTVGSSTFTQTASGQGAFAEGAGTTAYGLNAHAEGFETVAYGERSHAEGHKTNASGTVSHTEGGSTKASGMYSHAEGFKAFALAGYAHAEGAVTRASGMYSHAEGHHTMTIGQYAHAEGSGYKNDNKIKVKSKSGNTLTVMNSVNGAQVGMYLVSSDNTQWTKITEVKSFYLTITVEDASWVPLNTDVYFYGAIAQGNYSHVEGHSCLALGECSHAEGMNTIAEGEYQHTEGRYNVASTSFAHITGIGSSQTSRKNGFTVDWSGNGWFNGSITVHDDTGDVTLTAAQLRQLLAGL